MSTVPETDVIRALAKLIHENGPSLRAASRRLGYTPCYLSKLLNQRAPVSKPLLDQLGFTSRKVTIYEVKE